MEKITGCADLSLLFLEPMCSFMYFHCDCRGETNLQNSGGNDSSNAFVNLSKPHSGKDSAK